MISLRAYAKINWTLDILGKRPDGYHEMDMLMQSISLHDEITIEPADELSLLPTGSSAANQNSAPLEYGETNLVMRAARALCQFSEKTCSAKMTLKKNIPSQAGLGGGSADAAAVLIGLNDFWHLQLRMDELLRIGAKLGADIPFLLTGGFARVTGLGERIQPLPALRKRYLLLIQPCKGLSTPEVFRTYDQSQTENLRHPDNDRTAALLLTNQDTRLQYYAANVMEPINAARYPQIAQAVAALYEFGSDYAAMSGSGSVVFGSFIDEAKREYAFLSLQKTYTFLWKAETR